MHLSTIIPGSSTVSLLKFPAKPTQTSIIAKFKFGFSNSGLKSTNLAKYRCSCQLKDASDKEESDEVEREGKKKKKPKAFPWKSVFLGETTIPSKSNGSKKKKVIPKSDYIEDGSMDWCIRARRMALKSIEARGFGYKFERMVTPKKRKKKRKTKKGGNKRLDTRGINRIIEQLNEEEEDDVEEELLTLRIGDDDDEEENSDKNDRNAPKDKISHFADGLFEEERPRAKAAFVDKLSKFSGPSNRKKEISLNKQIIQALTAEEVLAVCSETITAVSKGLSPSPLSPINISTALHRIAKNMENVKMVEPRRLGFARQMEMALLVGIGMIALPECPSQGISNIAWALSKIGGDLLYTSEMDRVADVAGTKMAEFNAQNVANVAGAFASMRHASEGLFVKLVARAREIVDTFNEQEITQFLWACATLNVDTGPFLDALDEHFCDRVSLLNNESENEDENENENEDENENENENESENEVLENLDDLDSLDEIDGFKNLDEENSSNIEQEFTLNLTRDQIGNIAWSYAVLGQTGRPFFSKLWSILTQFEGQRISSQYRDDVLFASQVYIANQCLKVENPNSGLAISGDLAEEIYRVGKTKRFNMKISSLFQKEVAEVLVATGLPWCREYAIDGYTVDAVLVDRKLAFEMDGPTHFSRNLGTPLGHTVMKRRYIKAAGWNLVNLSYQEWQALDGQYEQLQYLRKILGIEVENDLIEFEQLNYLS